MTTDGPWNPKKHVVCRMTCVQKKRKKLKVLECVESERHVVATRSCVIIMSILLYRLTLFVWTMLLFLAPQPYYALP